MYIYQMEKSCIKFFNLKKKVHTKGYKTEKKFNNKIICMQKVTNLGKKGIR